MRRRKDREVDEVSENGAAVCFSRFRPGDWFPNADKTPAGMEKSKGGGEMGAGTSDSELDKRFRE
ncbi:hypothetical protein WN55_03572 [Dufourea novaeangliae]|uniref:Uncharacterized protein n=1 Tax=Dufourea novaeangliae TaxID=178035 RepID=A0A154PIT3_DUFNO|nr:hypothetical protein WN55_03572 [Dufourea novaeangliae]